MRRAPMHWTRSDGLALLLSYLPRLTGEVEEGRGRRNDHYDLAQPALQQIARDARAPEEERRSASHSRIPQGAAQQGRGREAPGHGGRRAGSADPRRRGRIQGAQEEEG